MTPPIQTVATHLPDALCIPVPQRVRPIAHSSDVRVNTVIKVLISTISLPIIGITALPAAAQTSSTGWMVAPASPSAPMTSAPTQAQPSPLPQAGLQPLMPLLPAAPQTDSPFTVQPPLPAVQSRETYILGAGDAIRIDIFDVPEFSGQNGQYTILSDGSLNLPWIGNVSVQNMTLEQAANTLAQRYARYIDDPLITVTLLAPRPMRIGIIGQVNRPGIYTVNPATGATSQKQTVSTAIQAAGGITQLANVRAIEVRRPTPSGEQSITVDLWRFLQAGDISQDIALQDGDTVVIPQADSIDPAESAQIAAASFSPATINVNIVGEVMRPGTLALPPNVSLNQAIMAAGGFNRQRARQSEVSLIRLNPDGTVTKREVDIDFAASLNDATNPPLRSNDIIVVGRSSLASTSDFLNTLLSPLNGVFSIFRVFDGLGTLLAPSPRNP